MDNNRSNKCMTTDEYMILSTEKLLKKYVLNFMSILKPVKNANRNMKALNL